MPGLDECNIAQSANGSLFLIARNCQQGNLNTCQMLHEHSSDAAGAAAAGERADGVGDHNFVYSISNDVSSCSIHHHWSLSSMLDLERCLGLGAGRGDVDGTAPAEAAHHARLSRLRHLLQGTG